MQGPQAHLYTLSGGCLFFPQITINRMKELPMKTPVLEGGSDGAVPVGDVPEDERRAKRWGVSEAGDISEGKRNNRGTKRDATE